MGNSEFLIPSFHLVSGTVPGDRCLPGGPVRAPATVPARHPGLIGGPGQGRSSNSTRSQEVWSVRCERTHSQFVIRDS